MRMLAAIDLNEGPEALLEQVVEWATRLSAQVDLVYVDEHSYDVYLVQDPSVRHVLDREWTKIREHQTTRLHELVAAMPEARRGEALLRSGRAADEIVEASKTRDVVLLATHGRKGVNHALLGSVAERVVRLASVPVIVVRRPASTV